MRTFTTDHGRARESRFHGALRIAVGLSLTTSPVFAQGPVPLELHGVVPGGARPVQCGAAGDLDGDGWPDLLLGLFNFGGPISERLDGDGFGALRPGTFAPAGLGEYTPSLGLGDWNGDGALDVFLAAGGHAGGRDRLFLNDGSGNFWPGGLSFTTDYTSFAGMADVDGDGLDDVLRGASILEIYFASGGSTNVAEWTSVARVGDLDGDGDADLSGIGGTTSWVALGDGLGSFAVLPGALPPDTGAGLDMRLLDADGDGDLDAWRVNGASFFGATTPDRLDRNDGSANFSEFVGSLPPDLDEGRALAVGDLDHDGDLDGVVGNVGLDRVLRNDGTGHYTEEVGALVAYADGTTYVELVDLDLDGDLDLLRGGAPYPLRAAYNDGTGALVDVSAGLRVPANAPRSVAFADLDGDLDVDVVLGRAHGANAVHRNGGGGDLDGGTPFTSGTDTTEALALGDVNGDGDADLALAQGTGAPELWFGDGSGGFAQAPGALPGGSTSNHHAAVLADVDGDADLDLLLGGDVAEGLFLGNGMGRFRSAEVLLPPHAGATFGLAVGDLDQDGDLDAWLANAGDGITGELNALWLGQGGGTFVDASGQLPPDADASRAVLLVDVDLDGDLDAVVGNAGDTFGWADRVYANQGGAIFAEVVGALPGEFNTWALAQADVDLDGVPDLLAPTSPSFGPFGSPGYTEGRAGYWIGDGTGSFVSGSDMELNGVLRVAGLADLDGDGVADVVGASDTRWVAALESSRQLAWRAVPRVGVTLVLDLWGQTDTTWALALSSGRAQVPLPDLGTLWLDPTSLFLLASGGFDVEGRSEYALSIPASPALLGVSLELQALHGPDLALGNLETAVLTGL